MPYVSDAQRKWAHTASAKKAGFPTEKWDKESKGQGDIPEHVRQKKEHFAKAMKKAHADYKKKYSNAPEMEQNPMNSMKV